MNLTHAINSYLDAVGNTRLAARAPSVFVPFAAFAALQCLLLTLLAFFAAPPIAPLMVPLVRVLGGAQALHYPMHFVLLPVVYDRLYVPLVATVGFAAWSYGVWVMVDHHAVGQARGHRSFRAALPRVVLVGVAFVGASVGLGWAFGFVGRHLPAGPPALAFLGVGIVVTACVQALLIYAPIVLRIRGGGVVAAIRGSAHYAWHHYPETAMVAATVLVAHAPLDAVLSQSHRIALRFSPELVFYLLVASIALEMFTAYFLFAATTGIALPEEGGMR